MLFVCIVVAEALHCSEADKEIAVAMRVRELKNEPITDSDEEEWYGKRLDAGLFELQQVRCV